MPWSISFGETDTFITLTYAGIVPAAELHAALVAAAALATQSGVDRFLADCSRMEGGHSVLDLYGLISLFEAVGLHRGMREALLFPSMQSSQEEVKFYEIACRNRGFYVRIFRERTDAEEWLRTED